MSPDIEMRCLLTGIHRLYNSLSLVDATEERDKFLRISTEARRRELIALRLAPTPCFSIDDVKKKIQQARNFWGFN